MSKPYSCFWLVGKTMVSFLGRFIYPPNLSGKFSPKKNTQCQILNTRWAPINYKWGYNFHKWGYNSSYPCIRPFIEVITPFITGRGPPCMFLLFFSQTSRIISLLTLRTTCIPKMMGLGKSGSFSTWPFLVSMLDFRGVYNHFPC